MLVAPASSSERGWLALLALFKEFAFAASGFDGAPRLAFLPSLQVLFTPSLLGSRPFRSMVLVVRTGTGVETIVFHFGGGGGGGGW
jgi:hypothetical protein